jgi:phage I-like protein
MKVTASFSALVSDDKQIMFIPEGEHGINPTVDGKPGSVVSKVSAERGEAIVAALNKSLEKRKSDNVRAIFDFDHLGTGPASAHPQSFEYIQGRGVMVNVKWSDSGEAAIKGGDYGYLSPVYNMDRATGEPTSLPKSGAIGALVNDPAFREIELIAAKRAKEAANSHNQQPEMDINVLIKAGLVTEAESKTDKVAEITAANIQTIQAKAAKVDGLEAEVVTLKASLKAGSEATADQLVKAAIDSGRIASKDEGTSKFWRGQLIEAANDPEKLKVVSAALNAIPAGDDITKKIVTVAGGQAKSGDKDQRFSEAMIQASKVLPNAGYAEQFNKAREIDPTAFEDDSQ